MSKTEIDIRIKIILTDENQMAIASHLGLKKVPSRTFIREFLTGVLDADLEDIYADYEQQEENDGK